MTPVSGLLKVEETGESFLHFLWRVVFFLRVFRKSLRDIDIGDYLNGPFFYALLQCVFILTRKVFGEAEEFHQKLVAGFVYRQVGVKDYVCCWILREDFGHACCHKGDKKTHHTPLPPKGNFYFVA